MSRPKPQAYLSFPISGLDISLVERRAREAQRAIERAHPGWTVVNPLDIGRETERMKSLSPREKYAREMGLDIEQLLRSEALISVGGIGRGPSAGCLMEQDIVDRWNLAHPDERITRYYWLDGELYEEGRETNLAPGGTPL